MNDTATVDVNQNVSNAHVPDTTVASASTPTDTPASTTGPADTAVSGQPNGDAPPEEQKPNRDRRAEKRIASLTRKNEELLTRLGRLEGMMEAGGRQPERQPDGNAKPQPSQYASYDEYVDAVTDWKVDQKLKARETEQQKTDRTQRDVSKANERTQALADRLMTDGKDIEDFEEVMETITADRFPVSAAMRDYLEEAERPALVAQWLAENPDQARRIYGMNSAAAVRELDKVAKDFAPKPARTTTAPPPVPTVGGRAVVTKDPEKQSMEEYAVEWRARKAKSSR